jgi:hypothetical protein
MAIHMTPLMGPELPPPATSDVEVYVAHCRNLAPTQLGGESCAAEEFTAATILVTISASDEDRLAFWPLRHALSFARCTVNGEPDWSDRLAEAVATARPEFCAALVYVGAAADLAAESAQSAIDTLRQQFGSALAVVVAVSANLESLASVRGITGCVRGVAATTAETARQVFMALSTLMAPETLNGIDIVDLRPVLGPANAPTVMAEAMWLRADGGRLVCSSDADERAVANAGWIVSIPLIREWGWDELRRLHRAVRDKATASPTCIVFATNNSLMPSTFPSSVGPVLFLCSEPADPAA